MTWTLATWTAEPGPRDERRDGDTAPGEADPILPTDDCSTRIEEPRRRSIVPAHTAPVRNG
jgi:hypothetical protein